MHSKFEFKYGRQTIALDLPAEADVITYNIQEAHPLNAMTAIVEKALCNPIGMPMLAHAAQGAKNAVIIVSDASRMIPTAQILPMLINQLHQAGVTDSQIEIIIALGAHRPLTDSEKAALVGEKLFLTYPVHNHSPLSEDCIPLGTSSRGTPLEINKRVASADFVLLTGNIEPHGLAGFSGGAKAVFPGTASLRGIEHNHALSRAYPAEPGQKETVVRSDLEEVLAYLPNTYLFNVITDHRRNIVHAVCGHVIQAHRAGAEYAANIFLVGGAKKYDVAVVSCGGAPKDRQLYQAIKTLQNAGQIVKNNGHILLIAACEEQFGNGTFQHWIETIHDRQTRLARIQQQFVLGAHKIIHLEALLKNKSIWLYSHMPEAVVELTGMKAIQSVAHLQQTIHKLSETYQDIAVVPFGALTFPQ